MVLLYICKQLPVNNLAFLSLNRIFAAGKTSLTSLTSPTSPISPTRLTRLMKNNCLKIWRLTEMSLSLCPNRLKQTTNKR